MTDRFDEAKQAIMTFVEERDWAKDHDPKSLLLALMGEVGEVAEILQWKGSDELLMLRSPATLDYERVRNELADVLIYLIELAEWLEIDLIDAVHMKLAINARNYPAELARGNHDKHPGASSDEPAPASRRQDRE